MSASSRYKRTKLGMLPGDISIQAKARMLEKGESPYPAFGNPSKDYKRDVARMANRRNRRSRVWLSDGEV